MVMQPEHYSAFISIACIVGAGLSMYSYYVEMKLATDSSYEAMCDVSEEFSCSKVFKSQWVCIQFVHKLNKFAPLSCVVCPDFYRTLNIRKRSQFWDFDEFGGTQLLLLQFIILLLISSAVRCLLMCMRHCPMSSSIYNNFQRDIFIMILEMES